MEKTTSFYIESLDSGFVITDCDKKISKETVITATEYLLLKFSNIIDRIGHYGVNDMKINITVEENLPKCK